MASTSLLLMTILLLWLSKPAGAQNPLSDVGSWPSGAVLLLGGSYAALRASSRHYFDALPPVCVSTLWHRVPVVKRWLKTGKAGAHFAGIVLENSSESRTVRLEWDRVICSAPRRADEEAQENTNSTASKCAPGQGVEEGEIFRISADGDGKTPKVCIRITASSVDANLLEQATRMLYDRLDLAANGVQSLLMKWRGLIAYRKKQARWTRSNIPSQDELQCCIDNLVDLVKTRRCSDDALETRLKNLEKYQIQFAVTDGPGDGERVTGHWWGLAKVNACQLVAMQAYSELLRKPQHRTKDVDLNPLLPCLQLWRRGMLERSDCFHISLPPDNLFELQQTRNDSTTPEVQPCTAALSYTLELQKGPHYLDGLSSLSYIVPSFTLWHLSWLVSLLSACVLAFFVIVASNASPSLATALALSFAMPHANDYSYKDAGSPPLWNGRVRIRWGGGSAGDSYAAGLFCGPYRGYPGSTGSSTVRCCTVLAVSWATWACRLRLRQLLEFEPDRPVAQWVKWVAVGGLLSIGPLIFLFVWNQRDQGFQRKMVPLLLLSGVGCGLGSCIVAWMVARGMETWYVALLVSEGGFLFGGSLLAAIVFTGIPRCNGMFMTSTDVFWAVYVLASCLNG